MAKSYSDELAEWVARRPSSRRDRNVVAFLAVRDDVAEAFSKGYSVFTIWEHMYEKKRVTVRYQAFLLYVNRYVRRPKEAPDAIAVAPEPCSPAVVKATGRKHSTVFAAKSPQPSAAAGFTFNAAPNKEELL